MKIRQNLLITLAYTMGLISQLQAQGYIVPNGVTQAPYGNIYSFHVLQNPTNGNYTDFVLVLQTGSSFLFSSALDEGVRVFFVSANDPVSLPAIQSGSYTELLYPNTYNLVEGNPFYVGLYTSDVFPQNGIYSNAMFGWAQLVNNGGVVELLGGQLAYGADGIYAGTTTLIPIPEPTTLSLLGLGLLALGWHGRRSGAFVS